MENIKLIDMSDVLMLEQGVKNQEVMNQFLAHPRFFLRIGQDGRARFFDENLGIYDSWFVATSRVKEIHIFETYAYIITESGSKYSFVQAVDDVVEHAANK